MQKKKTETRVRVPGKLILSGEHSVVYGRPALVTAVDRRVSALCRARPGGTILLILPGRKPLRHTRQSLEALGDETARRFEQFESGARSIETVLPEPAGLVAYAAALFFRRHPAASGGIELLLQSEVPVGCGMGSSAAAAAAVLEALAAGHGMAPDAERLYTDALEVERMRHGRPSGVDPCIAVRGGTLWFQRGGFEPLSVPEADWQLVFTGRPATGTGACVMRVAESFASDEALWSEFETVSVRLRKALIAADRAGVIEAVRANHRLLSRIGVTPSRVQRFIAAVEAAGGAAKICGAGAVEGEAAGVLLVTGLEPETLDEHCAAYNYTSWMVKGGVHGAKRS